VLGSTVPRLWTPPLRELTPETSFGFSIIDHATNQCGQPLDPWQEWAVVHAGELLPGGLPRFRIVIILVSRQCGKTELVKLVTSWWLHVDLPASPWVPRVKQPTVLGTSSKLDYARESWAELVKMTFSVPELAAECAPRRKAVREANGEQHLITLHDTRYKIAAANTDAGRSLTVARLVLDEFRQHRDWSVWSAAEPTTSAVADAQIWCLSNAGTDSSEPLNTMRDAAVKDIEDGTTADTDVCLIEYSAPDGSDAEDVSALAQANPALNRRKPLGPLLASARRAKRRGGKHLVEFQTEHMCMRSRTHDPAINEPAWQLGGQPGTLDAVKDRLALCVDVSLDGLHAIVVAAALLDDERVRVSTVADWDGPGCTRALRAALPGLARKIRPRVIGWFPNGPAAGVAAELAERKAAGRRSSWPPPGVRIAAITSETTAVCMGLAEQVLSGQVLHSNDPLLDAHVLGTEMAARGDAWVFARRTGGPVNGAYAVAGAVHLARTLPPRVGKPRIVTAIPAGR